MIKKVLIALLVVGGVLVAVNQYLLMRTKSHSPQDTVHLEHGGLDVEIVYCRPYKKGRRIFGGLVPFGEVWRTGANEATTLRTGTDIVFAGQKLKAGLYSLFTIPHPQEWTVVLNRNAKQWGAFDYDSKDDVLRVEAATGRTDQPVEQFTMELTPNGDNEAVLGLSWEDTRIQVPIEAL